MRDVSRLVKFFEGFSKPERQLPATNTHPVQHGISNTKKPPLSVKKTCDLSGIGCSNITNVNDVTDKSRSGLQNNRKSQFSVVYNNIPSFFKHGTPSQNVASANLVSFDTRQTDDQEIKQTTEVPQDCSEMGGFDKPKERTNLPGESPQCKKETINVASTSPKHLKQFLGSNKNIAFLVSDEKTESQAAVGNPQRTKIIDDDEITTRKERNLQHANDPEQTATTCQLPRFSLFGGESRSGSLSEPDTVDCIRRRSVSICSEQSHEENYENEHDQNHDNRETKAKYPQHKSTETSQTSGYYSSSNPALNDSKLNLTKGGEKAENQARNTERYVQETFAGRQLKSQIKYPSEPTAIQDMSLKTRTLTQENVFNIKGSNVSISSGNGSRYSESLTASQMSILSSDAQETREAIAEQTKEILADHAKGLHGPELRRLKKAKKVLKEEGVVLIADNKGSGSTHLGWDLLLADNSTEKFNVLDLNSLAICLRSKGSKAILLDDFFGETSLDESAVESCLKYIKLCRKNRTMKLIITLKHHILSKCKRRLRDHKKCIVDLEEPNLRLNGDDMITIMRSMIENNEEDLKVQLDCGYNQNLIQRANKGWIQISEYFLTQVAEIALPSGFPKKFKQFLETRANIRQGLDFFTKPTEDLMDEVNNMSRSTDQTDSMKYLTLVLTTVFGGKLTLEKVDSVNGNLTQTMPSAVKTKWKGKCKSKIKKDTKHTVESLWWIDITRDYSCRCEKSLLESAKVGISSLKGQYLIEDRKGVFSFAAPCVENAVLLCLGRDYPQHILKLCDNLFFQDYIVSESCLDINEDWCVRIDVLNEAVRSKAIEMLLELADSGEIELLSKHRLFRDQQFLQQFFDSFGKDTDRLWNIGMRKDKNSGRCVVECTIDVQQQRSHCAMTHNFAYSLLLQNVWVQKRKVNKEWSAKMEKELIRHCCKQGHKDIYLELRRKYNIPIDYDCLQAAVDSGSYVIVDNLLQSIGKNISDEEKCNCMELALLRYTKTPLRSRHEVVNALLKFVSVDYKISGIDPVIHTAAKSGDARVIVTLEVFDGDINVTNIDGKTCLHEAIVRNKAAFLLMALQHGADQKKSDKSGVLPIHEGAKRNKPYIMRLLIEDDSDVTVALDRSGRQPLHYAAIYNSVEAANVLLECGVEVNAYDCEQSTPLHYAAASGKASVIHSLLEANADIEKTDKDGKSPLLIACETGNVKGVKRIIRDISKKELDVSQNECLFVAVEENQTDILKMLIDKGFDVNQKNRGDKTLLTFAIEMNADLVSYLVEEKADVNMSCEGRFPLHAAASKGDREVFQTLVDAGANIVGLTYNNDTVLHTAITNGHDDLVYCILQKTEDLIGSRNKHGEVPLHIAACKGNLSITRALLARGAERSPLNKRCKTPLCLVEEKLEELQGQITKDEYRRYYSVMMLLEGHKVMLETAL